MLFGLLEIILSQIPHFHDTKWLSVVAALVAIAYSLIGLGLSCTQVIGMYYVD